MRTDDAGHGGGGLDKLWGSSAVDYLGRGIDAEAHLERERHCSAIPSLDLRPGSQAFVCVLG